MYISKVSIRNFRAFDDSGITAALKAGVNAIIGENNSGKSSFIDAIRLALTVGVYRKDIYFSFSDFHIDTKGQRSNKANIDIYFDDVPADLFKIWDPENTTKGELHVCFYIATSQEGKERIRYQAWGGPVEGNTLSSETLEAIQTIYLSALRDANNELKPARSGKLSALFTSIVNANVTKTQVLSAAERANSEIESQSSVTELRDTINKNLSVLEQDLLRQKVGIGLVPPKFESIAASLRAWLHPRWIYISNDNPVLSSLWKCELISIISEKIEAGEILVRNSRLPEDLIKTKTKERIGRKYSTEFLEQPLYEFFEKRTSVGTVISSVHGVKGETFDATLLIVDSKSGKTITPSFLEHGDLNSELMRIAYVAMTRPRKLLVVAIPKQKKNQLMKRFPKDLWDYIEV